MACVSGWLLLAALPAKDAQPLSVLLARVWESHSILVLVCSFAGFISIVFAVRYIRLRYLTAISRLVEQLAMRCARSAWSRYQLRAALTKSVGHAANALLQERDTLRHQVQTVIEESTAQLATERNQLATLMAELKQSIVVCNAYGRCCCSMRGA